MYFNQELEGEGVVRKSKLQDLLETQQSMIEERDALLNSGDLVDHIIATEMHNIGIEKIEARIQRLIFDEVEGLKSRARIQREELNAHCASIGIPPSAYKTHVENDEIPNDSFGSFLAGLIVAIPASITLWVLIGLLIAQLRDFF